MVKYKLDEEQLTTLYDYDKQNRFDNVKDWISYYNLNDLEAISQIIRNVFQKSFNHVIVSFKQLCKREILNKKRWKSLKPRGIVIPIGNRWFMYFIGKQGCPFHELGILQVYEVTEYSKPKKRYYKTSTPF
jgi:hypothetical protein